MNNNDLWTMAWILIILLMGLGLSYHIDLEHKHQIIMECIKQGEIQNNPICSQYVKK